MTHHSSSPLATVTTGATHQLYSWLLGACGRHHSSRVDDGEEQRDRGAVSLEQVLWFVAAGVAVAAIANVLWGRIFDQANDADNIILPQDPSGMP